MPMADSDRIVFPDEASEMKAAAVEAQEKTEEAVDTNTVEAAPPSVTMRNLVQVPANCPAGFQMGADGICREVFN